MSAFTEPQRGPPRQPCRPPIANHHKLGRRDSDVEDPPAQMPAGQRSPKGPAPPSENWVFCRASRCASDYAPFPAQASSIAAELPHTELSRGNRREIAILQCAVSIPHIAKSPSKLLKNNRPTDAQCARFYLAIGLRSCFAALPRQHQPRALPRGNVRQSLLPEDLRKEVEDF